MKRVVVGLSVCVLVLAACGSSNSSGTAANVAGGSAGSVASAPTTTASTTTTVLDRRHEVVACGETGNESPYGFEIVAIDTTTGAVTPISQFSFDSRGLSVDGRALGDMNSWVTCSSPGVFNKTYTQLAVVTSDSGSQESLPAIVDSANGTVTPEESSGIDPNAFTPHPHTTDAAAFSPVTDDLWWIDASDSGYVTAMSHGGKSVRIPVDPGTFDTSSSQMDFQPNGTPVFAPEGPQGPSGTWFGPQGPVATSTVTGPDIPDPYGGLGLPDTYTVIAGSRSGTALMANQPGDDVASGIWVMWRYTFDSGGNTSTPVRVAQIQGSWQHFVFLRGPTS